MSLANPTMDVLMEVLEGADGCGGHFPDACCTNCRGYEHLIEHGYLKRGPEERKRFYKAMHAKKLSGWGAQIAADEEERAGAVKAPGRGTPEAVEWARATVAQLSELGVSSNDIVDAVKLSLESEPAEADEKERPRTEDFDCEGCGEAARFLHMGSAWCSETCRDDWVRAANQAVKRERFINERWK